MSGKILLDTNIVIALFADDSTVLSALNTADEVFLPSIVIGELWFGTLKSVKPVQNMERIREFAAFVTVVGVDQTISETYGDIKNRLRKKGRPIPENDIWIAAIAKNLDLVLATRDEHFDEIEDVIQYQW